MIPLQYIRTNIKEVKEMLKRRKSDFDLKGFLIVDKDLKENQIKLDELLARRNILSKERTPEAIARGKKIKQDIIDLTEIVDKLTKMRDELWAFIPNFLDPRVPDGDSDADNVEMKKVGVVPKFDFKPKWHDELAQSLDILDIKAGTKVTGSGFFYWKGKGARLVTAVMNFVLDTLEKRGFTQMITPIVAKEHTFFGTGYLPFAEDQLYTVKSDNISLIGTSEQTMVAYHQDEIIDLTKPKLYCSLTPCFRTEAGSYGRETKGIFRVHQFYKVEQIIICKGEESEKYHQFAQENEEFILNELGIPFRVVNVCTGDMGAPGAMKYDIEGYFAGYDGYRELTSNSNLLEYQTRRLNIKYKNEKGEKLYPHTISATGITERAVLAIIENNQNADGSINVPKVLQSYMGGIERIEKVGK